METPSPNSMCRAGETVRSAWKQGLRRAAKSTAKPTEPGGQLEARFFLCCGRSPNSERSGKNCAKNMELVGFRGRLEARMAAQKDTSEHHNLLTFHRAVNTLTFWTERSESPPAPQRAGTPIPVPSAHLLTIR